MAEQEPCGASGKVVRLERGCVILGRLSMRFRRLVALVVSVACAAGVQPGLNAGAPAAGAQQPSVTAASGLTISGSVLREDRTTVANVRLRLRNVDKGAIVAQTVSDQNGAFSFPVTDPGLYVVEAVDGGGSVLAVSSSLQSTTTPLTTNVILPADSGPRTFSRARPSSSFRLRPARASSSWWSNGGERWRERRTGEPGTLRRCANARLAKQRDFVRSATLGHYGRPISTTGRHDPARVSNRRCAPVGPGRPWHAPPRSSERRLQVPVRRGECRSCSSCWARSSGRSRPLRCIGRRRV